MSDERVRLGWFRTCSGDERRVGLFRYWRGRLRLRIGLCPLCSSTPRRTCAVCQGRTTPRELWRRRFDGMRVSS